jgi:hypothetical protein
MGEFRNGQSRNFSGLLNFAEITRSFDFVRFDEMVFLVHIVVRQKHVPSGKASNGAMWRQQTSFQIMAGFARRSKPNCSTVA